MTIRSEEAPLGDQVTTTMHFRAPPESVWQCLMFYEDVPGRPWPLLRLVLPLPVRSEGDKLRVGEEVRCTYDRGYLVKRVTTVEAARHLRFEVVEQRLGIERYARTYCGTYDFRPGPDGTELALTTYYEGRLRPRVLWRPVERFVCHRVHRHILLGMRDRLADHHPILAAVTAVASDSAHTPAAASR